MTLSWWRRALCSLLRSAPIPQHIAFIMDGNRRFAQRHHIEKKIGHTKGYQKLEDVLEWCLALGVKIVTVYAFSIENFKRPLPEVEDLMTLAVEKFTKIANQGCVASQESYVYFAK